MNILGIIWMGFIAFGIAMYIILDGFSLGIGLLTPFMKKDNQRDVMVSTILPVWDGNETWLVFGGAALYGAFPLAFSLLLPAMYLPIFIMTIALIFRGVAFEFRLKAVKTKRLWDFSFFIGSLVVTFVQGLILGLFVRGFRVEQEAIILPGGEWFHPFGLFCGIALIFGYALLGSNRLIAKTTGALQERCFKISTVLQYIILLFAVAVSFWSPFLSAAIWNRWFDSDIVLYLALLPLLTLIFFLWHVLSLRHKSEHAPFWLSVGIFIVCYMGFLISTYPYIVPRKITYLQAAASSKTLLFMFIGAVILLPVLLYYTYHSYRVFKGKVLEHISY